MQLDDEESAGAPALAPLLQTFSPLALHVRRPPGPVVGRPVELTAIEQEMSSVASRGLAGLSVEGEPGIGKTRLLLAAIDMANARGLTTVAVAADEELSGPFLLARSIVGSPDALAAAEGTPAADALARCMDAMSGQDDPSLASLAPDRKLLRTYDLAAVAIRDLASRRPLALFVDDLQWADDDSLRLVRYLVRADSASPIFLMVAIRPEELALVTEAVNLLADMDRLGLVRRLTLSRFTQVETRELLEQVLGAPGERGERRGDARAGRGRPVHRRRDGARVPRRRPDPADRRHLDARAQRRAPGPLGGPHDDLAPRRAPAGRDEGLARVRGRPRAALQPEGPVRGRAPRRREPADDGGPRRLARSPPSPPGC